MTLTHLLDAHRSELPRHEEHPTNFDKKTMRNAVHAHDYTWCQHLAEQGLRKPLPALHQYAQTGNAEGITQALQGLLSSVLNERSFVGQTALHEAVGGNKRNVVETLLLWKADPNAEDDAGHTPLDVAHDLNLLDLAELLVSHGAQRGSDAQRNLPVLPPVLPSALSEPTTVS